MNMPNMLTMSLLVTAAIFVAPASARADTGLETFQVRFTYEPSATGEQIYADLKRTARKACDTHSRMLHMKSSVAACTRSVVRAGVATLARPDVTAAHEGAARFAGR